LNKTALLEIMNPLLIVFSLLTLFNPWKTFQSLEGRFEIEVPGELKHHVQQINTDLGAVDYHTYYLATQNDKEGNFVYQVSYYQAEALLIPADSVDLLADFFNATVEQSAKSVAGEVLILDDITYHNKFPGKFWRIHYNGGRTVMKTKAFLIEGIYYSIQVAVDADFSLDKDLDRFLNSFKYIATNR